MMRYRQTASSILCQLRYVGRIAQPAIAPYSFCRASLTISHMQHRILNYSHAKRMFVVGMLGQIVERKWL